MSGPSRKTGRRVFADPILRREGSPMRTAANTAPQSASAQQRVARYDWEATRAELATFGCAVLPELLTPSECADIAGLYPQEQHFRSHIHMARHGFGKG